MKGFLSSLHSKVELRSLEVNVKVPLSFAWLIFALVIVVWGAVVSGGGGGRPKVAVISASVVTSNSQVVPV